MWARNASTRSRAICWRESNRVTSKSNASPETKRGKKKGPQEKVYALTRYQAGPIAEVIREAAAFEGMSIASFQRKAVFEYLRKNPRFAERLAAALRSGKKAKGSGLLDQLRATVKRSEDDSSAA
jgi:hypothetical protein